MAGCEVFVQCFFGGGEAFVKMEGLYLHGYTAMDVFEAEIAGCGVAGIDDVEQVAVSIVIEECEGGCVLPVEEKVRVEVCGWVTFNGREGWVRLEVELVFGCREKGEEVFFELETNEFFGAHIAHSSWAGGIEFVPSVVDGC